jgi:hypothetical protein
VTEDELREVVDRAAKAARLGESGAMLCSISEALSLADTVGRIVIQHLDLVTLRRAAEEAHCSYTYLRSQARRLAQVYGAAERGGNEWLIHRWAIPFLPSGKGLRRLEEAKRET